MNVTKVISLLFVISGFFIFSSCGNDSHWSPEASDPVTDQPAPPKDHSDENEDDDDFSFHDPIDLEVLPDGRPLSAIKVRGSSLRLAKGSGHSFTEQKMREYTKLKSDSQSDPAHKVQWAFMDLDAGKILAHSMSADLKIFGASSSKIYVAATLLDKQQGALSDSQLQKVADMLVVSSNTAWTSLQKEIGDGSADKGRELNHEFTQRMGYPKTRGWQGYWGKIHGNELVPLETVETLYDIYQNRFSGAEWLWKLMHACRTGASRGLKYIPSSIIVGGKTGTYDGPTENPQTGEQYKVRMRNHVMMFKVEGRQYGLAVLANSGSNESAALIAGGLLREYTSIGATQ